MVGLLLSAGWSGNPGLLNLCHPWVMLPTFKGRTKVTQGGNTSPAVAPGHVVREIDQGISQVLLLPAKSLGGGLSVCKAFGGGRVDREERLGVWGYREMEG